MTANEAVLEKLNNWISENKDSLVFSLNAPGRFSVKFQDGGYKQYACAGKEEFFLASVREGKKDEFIFSFLPVDAKPFVAMEVADKIAVRSFDGLEEAIAKGMGFREDLTFGRVKGNMRRAVETEMKEKGLKLAQEAYVGHALWGTF